MEWLADLRGQIVGLDTAPLSYFIEEHPVYLATVLPFFQALHRREIQVVTSTVTLIEVLVRPLRHGDARLAQQYREILFNVTGLDTVPVSVAVAEEAARLRATYSLRAPDAVQLATAINAGAAAFLTNDTGLPRLATPRLLVLDEL